MITYSKTAADTKYRVRDLAWMHGRIFIFGAIALSPIAAYFLALGFIAGAAGTLGIGVQALTLIIVLLVVYYTLYRKFKKAVNGNFDNYEIDGQIEYTIEFTDEGTMIFTRMTDEDSFEISWSDVKKVKYLKHINVLVLKNKKTIDLPKSVDIADLITGAEDDTEEEE